MGMAKRFVLALTFVVCTYSFASGDMFFGQITKVDGNKVTFKKFAKKGEKGEEVTLEAAADVTVTKGAGFKKDAEKKGEPLEGGLKNDLFTKIAEGKGVAAQITTADDGANKGKITAISTFGGIGMKKGKKDDKTDEKK